MVPLSRECMFWARGTTGTSPEKHEDSIHEELREAGTPHSSRGAPSFIQQMQTRCRRHSLGPPCLTAALQAQQTWSGLELPYFGAPQTISQSVSRPLTALPEVYFICVCLESHPL